MRDRCDVGQSDTHFLEFMFNVGVFLVRARIWQSGNFLTFDVRKRASGVFNLQSQSMTHLTQDALVRTLLAQRARISAGVWLVVRDVHLAEDVFQEVMVKALANDGLFANEAQLLSWCRVTARNAALNLMRKRNREALMLCESMLERIDAEWDAAESLVPSTARFEALQDCIETLPEASRRMLDLRYFEGRSCAEVGKVLGVKVDAAYQRLSRLHRALRECVERRMNANRPDPA